MTLPIEVSLDSTSLGNASCILKYVRTVIGDPQEPEKGGYREKAMKASAVYGIAVHEFIDTMHKTGGNLKEAKTNMERAFDLPKVINDKKGYLGDPKHLFTTCLNLWEDYISKEASFQLIQIPQKCYRCEGQTPVDSVCLVCKGEGSLVLPATEQTFKIEIYRDEFIVVYLTGTIDKVGKFINGCYAIGDWKTTSSWDKEKYLKIYELSRQLRLYTLACKLMAERYPESTLGRIGASKMGAFIDAIFVKQKVHENEYERTRVYQFSDSEIDSFKVMINAFCFKISLYIKDLLNGGTLPKEGILNGTCDGKWGLCSFWNVCNVNPEVGKILLNRDFVRKKYDPLNFNE